MGIEREHLLPPEGFELAETSFPVVDGQCCVKVPTNRLLGSVVCRKPNPSAPPPGVRGSLARTELRGASRTQLRAPSGGLDLEHYLDVLERKPGALAGSTPLEQWRQRGRWPESFDQLWQSLAGAARQAGGHAGDDRPGSSAWMGSTEEKRSSKP
jgi:hypothetical protein